MNTAFEIFGFSPMNDVRAPRPEYVAETNVSLGVVQGEVGGLDLDNYDGRDVDITGLDFGFNENENAVTTDEVLELIGAAGVGHSDAATIDLGDYYFQSLVDAFNDQREFVTQHIPTGPRFRLEARNRYIASVSDARSRLLTNHVFDEHKAAAHVYTMIGIASAAVPGLALNSDFDGSGLLGRFRTDHMVNFSSRRPFTARTLKRITTQNTCEGRFFAGLDDDYEPYSPTSHLSTSLLEPRCQSCITTEVPVGMVRDVYKLLDIKNHGVEKFGEVAESIELGSFEHSQLLDLLAYFHGLVGHNAEDVNTHITHHDQRTYRALNEDYTCPTCFCRPDLISSVCNHFIASQMAGELGNVQNVDVLASCATVSFLSTVFFSMVMLGMKIVPTSYSSQGSILYKYVPRERNNLLHRFKEGCGSILLCRFEGIYDSLMAYAKLGAWFHSQFKDICDDDQKIERMMTKAWKAYGEANSELGY